MELLRGKDAYRISMNAECSGFALRGRTIDIGGGGARASYHRFFKKGAGVPVESLDLVGKTAHSGRAIDLERDALPYPDASVDTVLLFNVLEHIYAYPALLCEVRRVLSRGGRVYGATPFLVGYHPDPRDYWRFTDEALEKIFRDAGLKQVEIRPFGGGPLLAEFSQVEWMVPRMLRWLPYFLTRALEVPLLWWRPSLRKRFALGYFFVVESV